MSVAIIDYGSGNLRSAAKSFERGVRDDGLSLDVIVTADPDQVRAASHIVLPGVGAFADCRTGLMALDGMVEALERTDGGLGLFIQWHPEMMTDKYPEHTQAIYGFLVQLCLQGRQ